MATRNLATRMWTPAASALCRHPSPGTPPLLRSRLVGTVQTQQNYNATRKFSSETDGSAQALLERAKKQQEIARKFKGYLRNLKFMRWSLNLGISATVAAMVLERVNRV